MTVTVIIPTYNRAEYLEASLASILNQTRPPNRVVVVDDGSDDPGAVAEIVGRCPRAECGTRVEFLHTEKNRGKSAAVNLALQLADTDLVWIFDDDDLAIYDRLERVVPLFEADPDLDVVHTDADWLWVDGRREHWKAPDIPEGQMLRHQLSGNVWFSISVIWRRDMLRRLAEKETEFNEQCPDWPFDLRLERAQDYDFFIRLAWAGAKVAALHKVTVVARNHAGPRGIGHRLTPEQVQVRTQMAEQIIFQKLYQRIPFGTIFPDPEARHSGRIERAHALFQRSLLIEACADLDTIPRTRRAISGLPEGHRAALADMARAVTELLKKATPENLRILEGAGPEADPDWDETSRRRIREIRTQARRLAKRIDTLLRPGKPLGADDAARQVARTLTKGR